MQFNEFSYGEIESGTFGLTCDRETHYILPEQRKYVQEIPGMDGVVDFGIGGYGVRVITDTIYFDGDYADLRANRENIIAWLSNTAGATKQLIYGNEPDKYYMAKCYATINFSNTSDHNIGSIQWECNPPWQYQNGILLTPDQLAWNTADNVESNQYMKDFTCNGSIRFTNTGSMPVKPLIKLIGNIPSGLMLTYNGSYWRYTSSLLNDGIAIDCNVETVTRMSDGVNLFENVSPSADTYFTIAPGQAEIDLTATGLGAWPNDLTMIIEFNPQDMG